MLDTPATVSTRRIVGHVLVALGVIATAMAGMSWSQPVLSPHHARFIQPSQPTAPSIATRTVMPDSIDDYRYRLVRTPCYGPCPIFSLEIDADGMAHYVGPDHRRLRDTSNSIQVFRRERRLSPADRVELATLLERGDFWSLEPIYDLEPFVDARTGEMKSINVTDNPSTVLTVWRGTAMKVVSQHIVPCRRNYPGRLGNEILLAMPRPVPDVFCQLVDAIERTSCAGYWGLVAAGDDTDPPLPADPRCEGAS